MTQLCLFHDPKTGLVNSRTGMTSKKTHTQPPIPPVRFVPTVPGAPWGAMKSRLVTVGAPSVVTNRTIQENTEKTR
jgi:hypothetical protein